MIYFNASILKVCLTFFFFSGCQDSYPPKLAVMCSWTRKRKRGKACFRPCWFLLIGYKPAVTFMLCNFQSAPKDKDMLFFCFSKRVRAFLNIWRLAECIVGNKNPRSSRAPQLTPIILVTWEAEIRRITAASDHLPRWHFIELLTVAQFKIWWGWACA
jgi:hypothetical protein